MQPSTKQLQSSRLAGFHTASTQAGKGLYRRQEVQDLIALTRVLADGRDTLALGALLRGPLVGLSEQKLLDPIWALPRDPSDPEALPCLRLDIDLSAVAPGQGRDTFERLQALRRQANATTPHDLLCQAVDVLRVRPTLLQRHGGQADRALANVDLYLSFSHGYAVRGLRAFAEAMTAAWDDQARAVEGRPDAREEAVALYTMHAAKGLEWPVVIPINTMTQVIAPDAAVMDRITGHFYCPVFGVRPMGYEAAHDAEKAELERERVRLWYVAATRARELLVLPRLDVALKASTWVSLVDLALADLPPLATDHLPAHASATEDEPENLQTRERFAEEAAAIADRARRLVWRAPSRDEGTSEPVLAPLEPDIVFGDSDRPAETVPPQIAIQGGRDRGVVLHKLMEEVLTGETADREKDLRSRAEVLLRSIGGEVVRDPALGLSPAELAGCVLRTLALPKIAALRSRLLPEFPVYDASEMDGAEEVTAGVADALALDEEGRASVVIDWKSDVDPSPETLNHYRAQVSAYLGASEAGEGLIVFLTSGRVIRVTAPKRVGI